MRNKRKRETINAEKTNKISGYEIILTYFL